LKYNFFKKATCLAKAATRLARLRLAVLR